MKIHFLPLEGFTSSSHLLTQNIILIVSFCFLFCRTSQVMWSQFPLCCSLHVIHQLLYLRLHKWRERSSETQKTSKKKLTYKHQLYSVPAIPVVNCSRQVHAITEEKVT